ncbi:MAG: hypothetical protein R3F59_19930 [Myxococcota bacterium]
MTTIRTSFLALLVAGCGGPDLQKSCDHLVEVWQGCAEEAFADDADALDGVMAELEGTCDEYADVEGDAVDAAADQLDCYTQAVEGGDCGDPTSYAGVMLDVAGCNAGFAF